MTYPLDCSQKTNVAVSTLHFIFGSDPFKNNKTETEYFYFYKKYENVF